MQGTGHTEKIWLPGPKSQGKQKFAEWLCQSGVQADREFVNIIHMEEIPLEDRRDCLVLVFGEIASGSAPAPWQSLEELSEVLLRAADIRPRRMVLVSDTMVYGKLFGEQRLVKEDEIGYLSHTADGETAAQCMRTAENLCFRLTRERGLNAGIVRADWQAVFAGTKQSRLQETLLNILENGAPGEVFNLSEKSSKERLLQKEQCAQARSPLSPITVIPDTGKAEKYAAS